jgi:hypothetical protein
MATPEAALRSALARVARAGETITYQELARRLELPPPHRIHRLTTALEALVRADHVAGRPLLAAVAVSRVGGGLPGRGFFMLLNELGRYGGPPSGPQAETAHAEELVRVYAQWAATEGTGDRNGRVT